VQTKWCGGPFPPGDPGLSRRPGGGQLRIDPNGHLKDSSDIRRFGGVNILVRIGAELT
jgi:hypothetical protein